MTLPTVSRWQAPRFEHVPRELVPVRQKLGVEVRVHSGTSGALQVPPHTYLPMTMLDVRLAANTVVEQEVPASYNGFLYPLQGEVLVEGTAPPRLSLGQIGWLERGGTGTTVRVTAGKDGARVMLYAGERQDMPIVTHGPFVAESRIDLVRLSEAYGQGHMPRVSELNAVASKSKRPAAPR